MGYDKDKTITVIKTQSTVIKQKPKPEVKK
jgi:hypothetical protein